MPEIERLHRSYRARGLQVVGINIEGRSQDVLSYLDQGGYSFQVLFASGNWQSEVAQRYGVQSIPRSFLIDSEGRIVYSGHPSSLPESSIAMLLQ
jgi:thioredoxin-related protein